MFKQARKRLAAVVLVLILLIGMFPGAALAATAPSISWQPEDYTASAGWIVTFDVWASGTGPLFYQWYKDDVPLSDGGNIGGATTKNLIVGNVQASDMGSYKCNVYNVAGNMMSNAATLTVNPSVPSIVLQPASQTVTAGDNLSFKTAAVGSEPFTYHWKKDGSDLSDGGRFSGANTDTFSISGVTEADAGNYSCYITNAAGNATSSAAALTVNLQHTQPSIIVQPADKTAPLGGSAIFTVSAAGNTPFTYQWKKDGADLSNGGCISGATSSTLKIANLQKSNAGMYTCLVTNDYGSELSSEAELSVSPALPSISVPQPPVKNITNPLTYGMFYGSAVSGQIWSSDVTVDHCEYQLVADGGSLNDTWIQDSVFTIAPDFKGRFYARAVYANGTASGNRTQALVVDATRPVISAYYNELSGSITVTVTDGCAGIESITYQVGSGAQQAIDLGPSSARGLTTEHTFTIASLPVGQYNVVINATDNSRNTADTKTIGIDRADTPVTGITVTGAGGADSAKMGDTLQMLASVFPANTIHKAVTWSIESGSSLASIDAAGLLTATAAGEVTVRATALDGSGVFGEKTITVKPLGKAPDITTTALPGGTVGKTYNQALAAAGDTPIAWRIDSGSLPNGLGLSGSTISGTPTTAGTFNFTVKAMNAAGNDTQALSIVINTAFSTDKTLLSVTPPTAVTGIAHGAAKTAAALGLPTAVTLVTDSGNVSASASWDVASCSYDPSASAEQTFTVSGTASLPSGVINPNSISLNVAVSVTVNAAPAPTHTHTHTPTHTSTPATPSSSPTASPTATAGPSPSASASSVPTPTASPGDNLTIAPEAVIQDEGTGLIVVEIAVDTLPAGTAAIRLPGGKVINIGDAANGKIRLEIGEDDLDEGGELVITVLNDEEVALGSYGIPVTGNEGHLLIPDTGNDNGGIAVWLWILIGIGVLALGSLTVFIILKKKAGV